VGPLNELRIEQNGQLLWDKRASTTEAIEGPINWPIRPLTSGEVITLKLRPRGASGGDFVSYTFRVDDKKALEANRIKLAQLGRESSSWYRYIESIGTRQHTSVAPLIASPTMPDDLRQQLNCTEALK
jgi:hypothetical protein